MAKRIFHINSKRARNKQHINASLCTVVAAVLTLTHSNNTGGNARARAASTYSGIMTS